MSFNYNKRKLISGILAATLVGSICSANAETLNKNEKEKNLNFNNILNLGNDQKETTGSAIKMSMKNIGISPNMKSAWGNSDAEGFMEFTGDDLQDINIMIELFRIQEIQGRESCFYHFFDVENSEKWDAFIRELYETKIKAWVVSAAQDSEVRADLVQMLIDGYDNEYLSLAAYEGKSVKEHMSEKYRNLFRRIGNVWNFDGEELINMSIQEIESLDYKAEYMGIKFKEHIIDKYLQGLERIIQSLTEENWNEIYSSELYKSAIYKLSELKILGVDYKGEGSIDDTITILVNDIKKHVNGLGDKKDMYLSIDKSLVHKRIGGALSKKNDERKGIVGKYYTGVNSEDFDHDENSTDDGSLIFQENYLVALKLEEKGTNFDIRKTLYGLYDEELDKTNEDVSYHKGLKKVEYKATLEAPSTEEYTVRAYLDDEIYDMDGDYVVDIRFEDSNGTSVSGRKRGVWKVNMEAGEAYTVKINVKGADPDIHLPDNIKVKWEYGETEEEVISNEYFTVLDYAKLNSKNNLIIEHLDPVGDADMDGIPNAWEIEGFIVDGNTIRKYDESIHEGRVVYRTSPVDASTDGDPYSDLEESLGANISGVTEEGKHPLIAAVPEIVAELEGMTINARMKNKFTEEESTNTVNLDSTSNTTADKSTVKHSQELEFSMGVNSSGYFGMSSKQGKHGFKTNGNAGVTSTTKYVNTDEDEDVTTTIVNLSTTTTEDQTTLQSLSSTIDTFKSGDLSFRMKLRNIGTATAFDIEPNVSLYIGSDVGSTSSPFTTVESPAYFDDLAPGDVSQVVNIETRQVTDTRQLYLTVTKEVADKIGKGYPVSLEMNNASSKVIVDGDTRGKWDEYVNKINGITATINHQDAVQGLKKYKVFASRKEDVYKPAPSVGEALGYIYGEDFELDGDVIKINNKPLINLTVFANDISELKELVKNKSDVINILDLELRPEMKINIETGRENETKPMIVNTIYKNGKIEAFVLGNCSDIETVTAVMDINGSNIELELQRNHEDNNLFQYEFDEPVAVDIEGTNTVRAVDLNGNESEIELFIADAFVIKEQIRKEEFGSKYFDLESDVRLENRTDATNFRRENPATSYVVTYPWRYNKGSAMTQIVKAEELENIDFRNAYVEGYFGDEGMKFVNTYDKEHDIWLDKRTNERSLKIQTPYKDAKVFVVMVGETGNKNKQKRNRIEINERQMRVENYYGASRLKNNNLMFVEANEENPQILDLKCSIETDLSYDLKELKEFNLQIVGYFTDGDGYNYKELSQGIRVQTVSSNMKSRVERVIDGTFFEPKAFMIKVEGSQPNEQRDSVLCINGVKMAKSATRDITYKKYVVVPAASDGNKLYIDIENPRSENVANYNIEVVGYFY